MIKSWGAKLITDHFKISIRSVLKRRVRSWLTIIGIFIGIAAIVSLISLGRGMENAIASQFSSLGTDKLTVTASGTGFGPPGSTAVKKLTTGNIDAIRKINGVDLAFSRMIRSARTEFNDKQIFNYLEEKTLHLGKSLHDMAA